MSYTYDQPKQPQEKKKAEPSKAEESAPRLNVMTAGQAAAPSGEGGSPNLEADMQAKMANRFGDLSALREALRRSAEAPASRGADSPEPYTGPVTHTLSDAAPSPAAAGPMQAKRDLSGKGKNTVVPNGPLLPPEAETQEPDSNPMLNSQDIGPKDPLKKPAATPETGVASNPASPKTPVPKTSLSHFPSYLRNRRPPAWQPASPHTSHFPSYLRNRPKKPEEFKTIEEANKHFGVTMTPKDDGSGNEYKVFEGGLYDRWIKDVNQAPDGQKSLEALYKYTLNPEEDSAYGKIYNPGNYQEVNAYLRSPGNISKLPEQVRGRAEEVWNEADEQAKAMDSAIAKSKLDQTIIVHRYTTGTMFRNTIDPEEIKRQNVVKDAGFTSTALAADASQVDSKRPILCKIEVPAGIGRGAYIAPLSKYGGEGEFLLKRDSEFVIQDAYRDEKINKTVVIMKLKTNDEEKKE